MGNYESGWPSDRIKGLVADEAHDQTPSVVHKLIESAQRTVKLTFDHVATLDKCEEQWATVSD